MAGAFPTTSSNCDECGARILRQPRLPRRQEGPGVGCVGRLQRGVTESISQFYNLDPVPPEPFDQLHKRPDYPEIIRVLTNGWGEWKLNNDGHAVHFKAKHLDFIPKVWHHFITSRLIPMKNVCEVTAKRALLNYAIIQDIPFDVRHVIEDAILHNRDAKMNLGHPFLIYGLCKRA